MTTLVDNLENKSQVNHKDMDRTNNCLTNLEWVTPSENIIHERKNGNKRKMPKRTIEHSNKIWEARRKNKLKK